jgi:3-deoxy-7-phosphoheptulonate synthase
MSFKQLQKIPDAQTIKALLPLPPALAALKAQRDREIIAVFTRAADKFLLVIGPCSADNEDAVCDYINRLARVQEQVREKLVLVPRIYTNKPRTTGEGYKGIGHQPNPQEDPDILEGLKALRRMHIRSLADTHLTAADEMLYPDNYVYLDDILSYVTIGARSVENQHHRLVVSGLDIPVGMKNPTSGDIEVMFNAIYAAQHPHVLSYNGWEVATPGNPLIHGILRGAVNHFGQNISNYHYEDLVKTAEAYQKRGLANPTLIVDTNHSNSNKIFSDQPRIAREIIENRRHSNLLRSMVRGLMIESYLQEGAQPPGGTVYGQSITDSCLGWEDTEQLILDIAERV